jgi:hypothetical protein
MLPIGKKQSIGYHHEIFFWNIRGSEPPGRNLSLEHVIKSNRVDLIGVKPRKKPSVLVFSKILLIQLPLVGISFLQLGLQEGYSQGPEMMC